MAEYTATPLPENGIPIAWTLSPVFTAADGNVTGGVIRTEICSLVSGHLSPAQYEPVTDRTKTGISLLRRMVGKALDLFRDEPILGMEHIRLYLHAPESLLLADDPYAELSGLSGREGRGQMHPVVLTFESSVLSRPVKAVAEGFSAIRAAGYPVAVRGFGAPDFPTGALMEATPDAVFLHPSLTARLSGGLRTEAAVAMLHFAAGLGIQTIAEGVADDAAIRTLYAADSIGYLPAGEYSGAYPGRAVMLAPAAFVGAVKEVVP